MAGSVDVLPDNWTFMERNPKLEVEATFIVGDFEKEMKICKPGEKMESRSFLLGEIPFKIEVYPNEVNKAYRNHLSLFFTNESNTDDVNVDIEFEIVNTKMLGFENETLKARKGSVNIKVVLAIFGPIHWYCH